MSTQLEVGMEINGRAISDLCCQTLVDATLVTAVRFWDGSFGIVTSGDREPDLWPVGPAAASFIAAASGIDEVLLVRKETEEDPHQHVCLVGVRDGRDFKVLLFFGMMLKSHPKEDQIIWS